MPETASATTPHIDPTQSLVETILSESPLGMSATARRLGTFRDGKATHPSTITRWATRGVQLPDGRLLKLEAVRVNGRLVTSWPAILRFIAAQQPPDSNGHRLETTPRTPGERRRA